MAKPPPPKDNETKPQNENSDVKRFSQFDLTGKVFIVTGGAQGLGLEMAGALAEAGAKGRQASFTLPFLTHKPISPFF